VESSLSVSTAPHIDVARTRQVSGKRLQKVVSNRVEKRADGEGPVYQIGGPSILASVETFVV
jgi:hypothetical protein